MFVLLHHDVKKDMVIANITVNVKVTCIVVREMTNLRELLLIIDVQV